jgi:hypothetical protein
MPRPGPVPRACAAAVAWHRIGNTPLMEAAWNGHADAVALLARMGADVNAQTIHG